MMKRTILDQIEVTRDGTIQLRLAKEVVDDDGAVLSSRWVRTALPPGHDVQTQIAALNSHLSAEGWEDVSGGDVTKVEQVATVTWTEEVLAAYSSRAASSDGS